MIPRTGGEDIGAHDEGLPQSPLRVALVHEWLVHPAGSEAILAELIHLFPTATVFSLLDRLSVRDRTALGVGHTIQSPLGNLPGIGKWYRAALPLMPWSVEQLDVSGFDLVLSVSHAVAKGVRTTSRQFHATICCTPMRYAWDLEDAYLAGSSIRAGLARPLLARLRAWDRATASRPNAVFAISSYISERIERCWHRRPDAVVYPPVDTTFFRDFSGDARRDYVTASRCVPYKRLDVLLDAFRELPDRTLTVIGSGPDFAGLVRRAPANVRMLGHQPREAVRAHLASARAFLFAAIEDFGIAPIEALACGTPVIAFNDGAARETIRPNDDGSAVGLLYDDRSPSGVAAAVREFESRIEPTVRRDACRARAESFSVEQFRRSLLTALRAAGVRLD